MNIFTKRLHLREFNLEDWEAVYLYRSDPEVKRYDTFGPNTVEEVHEILARAMQWQAVSPRTHYFAAMVLCETQQLIGECWKKWGWSESPHWRGRAINARMPVFAVLFGRINGQGEFTIR